ncbi:hypothetical protein TSOC_004424 [Tetrabaena socialis]|uniref:Uncharacterized protein n=1 Tax=Tetrabaena socialis TaxID=47790 RepID=A0A2J8A8Y5_9CHLO|nr:hypothetical protein TSOC_004424 [Tetrabaena socialis]|eukprot:PNH08970.1 hypothetical protein TSOC_004424 [Tetrabaena socialis]
MRRARISPSVLHTPRTQPPTAYDHSTPVCPLLQHSDHLPQAPAGVRSRRMGTKPVCRTSCTAARLSIGMRAGFTMRQQAIAAIHSKVLRLNSASVSALSTGHVVNLVSNDVRR